MNFREFFDHSSNNEIVALYQGNQFSIRDISRKTGKSIGEIYKILKNFGVTPNRKKPNNHHTVKYLHDFGLDKKQISNISGYSLRNVNYILKK